MVKQLNKDEILKAASHFLLETINSYQIMPLDEMGNIDWQAYEPGCTPWNLLGEMTITSSDISSDQLEEDEDWQVLLSGVWTWSKNDYEPEDFMFEVYVPKNADLSTSQEFECERIY